MTKVTYKKMIRSYININTDGGDLLKYVRDVTTDTNGLGKYYYRYLGNGHQFAGLSIPDLGMTEDSGLKLETKYYFKVNVNGGGLTEYSITPTVNTRFYKDDNDNIINYNEVYNLLNRVAPSSFTVEYENDDFKFVAVGDTSGTSIVLGNGTTDADLFSSLKRWSSSFGVSVAGDNYYDQTGAGKVLGDFTTLSSSWVGTTGLLSFPESGGASTTVIRKQLLNGKDDGTHVVFQVHNSHVATITIVEQIEEGVYNIVYPDIP